MMVSGLRDLAYQAGAVPPRAAEASTMNITAIAANTVQTVAAQPKRYTPKFARLMQEIRQADPVLASAIQAQIVAAQSAERNARRLLAKYSIAKCRVPVLSFYGAGK